MPNQHDETRTISVRLPKPIVDWVYANHGGTFVKYLISEAYYTGQTAIKHLPLAKPVKNKSA